MLDDLPEALPDALVGDVDPERLEAYGFATRILPVFQLVRTLFSTSRLDTCLKLMVLHELTRMGGRSSLERIRALVPFLDPERVEALVRSLREGWLDLRESDRTYTVAAAGIHLLSVLHAADFGSLTPANALARAAQNAAFGVTLDGADRDSASYLLDQLAVLLDAEVEQARTVLQQGRPHRLIDWSRREHRDQLATIRGVLEALQERLDAGSRGFGQIVRLHEAMQEIVRLHTGIHTRLREWNLERLYTAEAGYSVPELLETVLGADGSALETVMATGVLQSPELPPGVCMEELAERLHGARRKLPTQADPFIYAPPPEPENVPWSPAALDPAAALRAHLTRLLADEAGPIEIEAWRGGGMFAGTAWDVALFARLHTDGGRLQLDDGRTARIELAVPIPEDVGHAQLLPWLVEHGGLRALPEGHFARLRVSVMHG